MEGRGKELKGSFCKRAKSVGIAEYGKRGETWKRRTMVKAMKGRERRSKDSAGRKGAALSKHWNA